MNQPHYRPMDSAGAPPPPPTKSGGVPAWLIAILVVVGAIVLIGGVLVVLAITGVRKYIAASKTAEARNALGQIARDAVAAYEREEMTMGAPTLVPKHVLCASASQPVPVSITQVSGKKYMASSAEWSVDKPANAGFSCLRFEMAMPQYYQYSYEATGTRSAVGDGFTATAHGDLNGNGVASTFTITGKIAPGDVVNVSPTLLETNPEE